MLEVHHRNIAVLLIIAILLGSGFWMLKRFHRSTTIATLIFGPPDFIVDQPTITQQSDSAQMQVLTSSHRQITAHIIGAVKQPDVYRLPFPAYLNDFVSAAGGFTDRANLNGLNLAQIVYDGDQVVIPTRTQNTNSGDQTGSQPSAYLGQAEQININVASPGELQRLSGIGPAMARRIITFRQTNGNFETIEDLTKIKGIGSKTLAKIRHQVRIK